jgi:hypothetical protein
MTTVQACQDLKKKAIVFWLLLLSAYLPNGYKIVEDKDDRPH